MNATYALRKKKLEIIFGVHISDDAVYFAEEVVRVYGEQPTPPNAMPAMNLVEKACRMLRKSLDSDTEETNLDWDEYCQGRAFVELMELRREKSIACRSVTLPCVEKELAECSSKLESFKNKWAPVVAQLRLVSEKRESLLRCMRDELIYFRKKTKFGFFQSNSISQLHSWLSTTISHLEHTIHSAFRERLVVGPHDIAKVASSMTGLPSKYFYWPFKLRPMMPKIEELKSRLSGKLIELDDVIHKIVHSLSKQKSLNGPLGSFLLLGPHGCGRTELAKSLAEEIYGDKDRVVKLDLSQYTKPDCISSLLHVLDRDKKQASVVMFENIENAHAWTFGVLSQIIRDGQLSFGRRISVNFSDDLVLVSSHIGHEVFCNCRCLQDTIPKIPFGEILKEPALLHAGISYKTCNLHDFYTKVANQFKPEFMDLFNDVVVFPWLTLQNHMAIARLQMRDVAISMSTSLKKKVILYPSDAALQNLVSYQDTSEKGAHAYETWHKVYMDPVLNDALENEADEMIIIYIDALVGLSDGFSFRVENGKYLQKDPILKRSKQDLQKLRSRYRQEKLQVNQLYTLQGSCLHLMELIHDKARVDAKDVLVESDNAVKLIDKLLNNEPSDNNELVQFDGDNGEILSFPRDRKRKRAKVCLKRVARRLQRSLKKRNKATQAITEALLRRLRASYNHQSTESSHLPASFLCLGLTPESKKQFAKSLGEHLVTDDGKKFLFEVDLSLCTEPDSFFRSAYTMDTHQLLTKAVKRRPHCVIVFHHLEMAHISNFSTILSILDDGGCKDNEGNVTNFGKSVIVIVSDLGNKEIIGGLNGHRPESKDSTNPIDFESTSSGEAAVGSSLTDEMGSRSFRYELLYRLDQLLLFDHFSDDQLNQFAKSPLKSLDEKSHSLYSAFAHLFDVQGKKKRRDGLDDNIKYIEEALGNVIKIRDDKQQADQDSNNPV